MRTKHELIMADKEGDLLAHKLLEIDVTPSYIPQKTRLMLILEACGQCKICGKYTEDLHIDHKLAVHNGGRCFYDNLQVLCRTCNLQKSYHGIDPRSYDVGYVIPIHMPTIRHELNALLDMVERANT